MHVHVHTCTREKETERKTATLKDLSEGGKQGQQESKLWQNSSIYKQKCISCDSQLVNLLMNDASRLLKQAKRVPTPTGLIGDRLSVARRSSISWCRLMPDAKTVTQILLLCDVLELHHVFTNNMHTRRAGEFKDE